MAKPRPKNRELPDLRFDFNNAVRGTRKDFPALKKHAMFVDAGNDNWNDIEQTLDDLAVDEDDIASIHKTYKDAKRLKTSFHIAVTRGGVEEPFSVVVFHPDKFPLFGRARGATDDACSFDHEAGHALTPLLEGCHAENIADAYAAVRHLQRTTDTDALDYCGWKRAFIFVTTGKSSHLTTFTVDKIICDRATADFVSLTPEETAAVAKAYAKKNTPSRKELDDLADEFKSLRKQPLKEQFRRLARITLAAKDDSGTFYLGARVLKGALQPGGNTVDGEDIHLEGREWDRVRDELDHRISGLPKGHPLRRL
jgi:hypothetical protein